ncbi:DUF1902 domain-containing protein [Dongia sp.]|uniref:DUF1902 domain-containing protein n=1 Tax=Dongia sp. TaxID=1977262 RepID=UPI0037521C4C
MADAKLKAKIVRVDREQGDAGLFYATSPDLKGLLVAEATLEALDRAIPAAIADLYQACDQDVIVTPVADGDQTRSWVAVPAAVARRELEAIGHRKTA